MCTPKVTIKSSHPTQAATVNRKAKTIDTHVIHKRRVIYIKSSKLQNKTKKTFIHYQAHTLQSGRLTGLKPLSIQATLFFFFFTFLSPPISWLNPSNLFSMLDPIILITMAIIQLYKPCSNNQKASLNNPSASFVHE